MPHIHSFFDSSQFSGADPSAEFLSKFQAVLLTILTLLWAYGVLGAFRDTDDDEHEHSHRP